MSVQAQKKTRLEWATLPPTILRPSCVLERASQSARVCSRLPFSALLLTPWPAPPRTTGSLTRRAFGFTTSTTVPGEPVVLIHGFTGSYARHFDTTGLMSRLASAGYRVIALDCRGHGQSGKPTDVTKYGLEMARDVVRLLDHLAIDRAHIVGYSMGGQIALKLLDTQSHRLMTATLIGAGWEGEDLTSLTSQLNEAAESLERRDAGFLLRALTPPGQGTPTDEQVAAANESLFARNDPKVLGAIMRGLIQLDQI